MVCEILGDRMACASSPGVSVTPVERIQCKVDVKGRRMEDMLRP